MAGRDLKYGEKTVYIGFRVPESRRNTIEKLVNKKLAAWEIAFIRKRSRNRNKTRK